MANVAFKRGLETSLAKSLYNYAGADAVQVTEGTFYLTSDTNRLYIGKNVDGKGIRAVPVNQGALPVPSIDALPSAEAAIPGQFYYVNSSNILCVSSNGKWVQINPNTDTSLSTRVTTGVVHTAGGKTFVQVSDVITDTSSMSFAGQHGIEGGVGLEVTVTEVTDGAAKYPVIKLTPSVYRVSAVVDTSAAGGKGAVDIVVDDGSADDVHKSTISFTAGSNVKITSGGEGKVNIAATDTGLDQTKSSMGFDANGKLSVNIGDTSGTIVTVTETPKIKLGNNATEYTFNGAVATLPVYTKAEVDAIKKDLNAMHYKGTAKNGVLATTASIGDTYKIVGNEFQIATNVVNNASDLSYDTTKANVNLKHGDLIIATGTEVEGVITAATLKWDVVESGEQGYVNTTYRIVKASSGHGFEFQDRNGNVTEAKFTVESNGYMAVSSSASGAENENIVLTLNHKEQANIPAAVNKEAEEKKTQTKTQSLTFSIPVLSYDKAGHLTKVEYQEYTVVDTHVTVASKGTLGSAENGVATISHIIDIDSIEHIMQMQIASSSLKVSTSESTVDGKPVTKVTIDLEWGTF